MGVTKQRQRSATEESRLLQLELWTEGPRLMEASKRARSSQLGARIASEALQ